MKKIFFLILEFKKKAIKNFALKIVYIELNLEKKIKKI
jgi:hypothetical protein